MHSAIGNTILNYPETDLWSFDETGDLFTRRQRQPVLIVSCRRAASGLSGSAAPARRTNP